MSCSTLLFDLDGTLLDSRRLAVDAASRALESLGHPVPSAEQIYGLIGLPEEEYYRGLLPPDAPAAHIATLRHEEIRCLEEGAPLFPGVLAWLEELSAAGHRLGLVTNAGRGYMEAALCSSGLERFLHVAFCTDDGADKTGLVAMALRELRKPGVMVGDREADWRAGRAHGLYTVGCLWGFGTPGELRGAHARVADVEELSSHLHPILMEMALRKGSPGVTIEP